MKDILRLLPYIRPNAALLLVALALLLASGALEAMLIMLLAPIFNQLSAVAGVEAAGNDKFAFLPEFLGLSGGSLGQIALFLVGFAFLKGLFLYFAEYSMSYTGQEVVAGLRKRLYRHILNQSLAFYTLHPTGKLMARVTVDTERVQETVSRTVTDFIRQVFLLIFFLGVVFYTDWKLALLALSIGPLVLGVIVRLGRKMRRISKKSQENLAELSHMLQETITGQRIVQAFGMEDYESRRFEATTDRLVRANLKAARLGAVVSPLIEFIGYVSFVPFLLYANYQMNRGFTIGAFVVFVAALFRLYEPVRKLSRIHLFFQQAFASSQRIFELLESDFRIREVPNAPDLPPMSRGIEFQEVTFAYEGPQSPPVLRDVDLQIRKGEVVALVGSSGAGKSSLASLIPRFFDVTKGRITLDGVDIREVSLKSLRRQISIVTQDTFLFNDTVKNNIAYGREDCRLEEIEEAARAAFIHDFVEGLPERYETVIGERGQRVSGGQRQRIAIARAILKGAPILILDEATSALDTESERLVQEALQNLMKTCTTLVIAHRLSTVRRADKIVVLEAGRIVETGSHQALFQSSGVYRRLHDLQFMDVGYAGS